jgi:ABC-type lipoprotein export system ATPase subunit
MIRVSELTKIYDKNNSPALDGVSFSLGDKGLVFIVGKSGSGKSTLLNILGGLDSMTGGTVEVDGNSLSSFTGGDFDKYRSSYVGFVYQDFCLFEDLTVKENIRLALDVLGKNDDGGIEKIVERVGLLGLLDRPVKKLSGGQKQRVAIARALIKAPRVILADEPTGNLDSKTSRQILELLSELSRESLVVIVSHNMTDANEYADRIIEIADGKIIRDEERTSGDNTLEINDEEIILPYSAVLSGEELEKINECKGERRIRQKNPSFVKARQPDGEGERARLESSRMKRGAIAFLSSRFLKKRKASFVFTVFILSVVAIILALCQSFAAYDGRETIDAVFANADEPAFILKKGRLSDDVFSELKKDKLGRITEEEIQGFYDAGYEGKVYRLTNYCMGILNRDLEEFKDVNLEDAFNGFYAKTNLGVLECDEELLTELYGVDGELRLLAGTLDYTEKPDGLILTDYLADSFIYYNQTYASLSGNPYQKLIDENPLKFRFRVLCVIDTGYKERYSSLISDYESYFKAQNSIERDRLMRKITSREDYLDFRAELTGYLSVAYTINPNFRQDSIELTERGRVISYFSNLDIYDEDGNLLREGYLLQSDNDEWINANAPYCDMGYHVENDNEIYLFYTIYNEIFGTELSPNDTSAFEEKTVIFKNYDACRSIDDEPLFTREYKVVGVTVGGGISSLLSDGEYEFVRQYDVYTTALYFTSIENCAEIYYMTDDTAFYSANQSLDAVYQVVDVVEIFKEYFSLIAVLVAAVGLLVLISYHTGNLKSRRYEIGVLRSLGAKTRDISGIFFLQSLLIGVVTAVLFLFGTLLLTDMVNEILIESFKTYIDSPAIAFLEGVKILKASLNATVFDISALLVISVLASVVPLISIRKIKPISIVRS